MGGFRLLGESELDRARFDLCKILTKIGSLKFGTFTLSSGSLSPYYIDMRLIPSHPHALQKVIDLYAMMAERIGLDKFDRISGVPTAGMAFSSILSFKLEKPFIYTRKETKTYGRERKVEGLMLPGDRILLVDDLITTGGSLLKAAEALTAEGGIVMGAMVMIDREEGGREALAERGIEFFAPLRITDAAKILYELETIDGEKYNAIIEYVRETRPRR